MRRLRPRALIPDEAADLAAGLVEDAGADAHLRAVNADSRKRVFRDHA